jgi:hypothetical protein
MEQTIGIVTSPTFSLTCADQCEGDLVVVEHFFGEAKGYAIGYKVDPATSRMDPAKPGIPGLTRSCMDGERNGRLAWVPGSR